MKETKISVVYNKEFFHPADFFNKPEPGIMQ